MPPDEGEGTLVADGVVVFGFVLDEFGGGLVDGVVRQVHEEVIQVVIARRYILFCSESGEAFSIHVDSKGVEATEEDIDTKIKFEAFD